MDDPDGTEHVDDVFQFPYSATGPVMPGDHEPVLPDKELKSLFLYFSGTWTILLFPLYHGIYPNFTTYKKCSY